MQQKGTSSWHSEQQLVTNQKTCEMQAQSMMPRATPRACNAVSQTRSH